MLSPDSWDVIIVYEFNQINKFHLKINFLFMQKYFIN
jgi:hypothetical protein